MLEVTDSWTGTIKGKPYKFFIETLTANKVNINCCIESGDRSDCLTYEVAPGMTRELS
jgi:hypothetical protein